MEDRILDIIRSLPGSWQLPIQSDSSITVTFYDNGHFTHLVSAYSMAKRGTQILIGPERTGNWHVRSHRGSGGGSVSSLSSRHSGPTAEPGPFLVLNFTDLPKARLNIQAFGFRIELANYVNDVLELFRDGNLRIAEYEKQRMVLKGPNGTQAWHRTA